MKGAMIAARRRSRLLGWAALVLLPLACLAPAAAQQSGRPPSRQQTEKPAQQAPAPPNEAEPPPPPYEPQLLRLSEILGALTFLRDLCGQGDGKDYRGRMNALLEAEASSVARKERLAGAYNRGYLGFSRTYRTCTVSASLAIERYIVEGAKLSRAITSRYGS